MSDVIGRPESPRRVLDKIPRQFGRYRIEETVGKGGMGAVFRAYDTQLDRHVALKVPFLGDDDEETRQRFYREARAAATLQHAYICPVFDVGEFQGIPYLTMAFIEGRSLNQAVLQGQTFTFGQIALLIRKIALGMQEAHSRGVVHRDLKPANIILRPNGEPVIMDFGLARRDDDKRSHGLTQEGDILGTLDYMSPEQAEGNQGSVGPASDIYALGAILYELLCGCRPFSGNTAAMLVQILTKEPKRPSEIRPGVPAKLEEICLKAMAKKPEDRFPTMLAFATALAEYLRGITQGSGAGSSVSGTTQRPVQAAALAETQRPAATQVTAKEPSSAGTTAPTNKPAPGSTARSSRKGPRSGRRRAKQQESSLTLVMAGAVALMALVGLGVVAAVLFWPRSQEHNDRVAAAGPTTPPNVSDPTARPAHGTHTRPPFAGPNADPNASQTPHLTAPGGPPGQAGPTPGGMMPLPPGVRPPGGGLPPQGGVPPFAGPGNPGPARPPGSGSFDLALEPEQFVLPVGQPQRVLVKLDRKGYSGPISVSLSAPPEFRVSPRAAQQVPNEQTEAAFTILATSLPGVPTTTIDVSATYDAEPGRSAVKSAFQVRAEASACVRVIEPEFKPAIDPIAMAFAPDLSFVLVGGAPASTPRGGGTPPPRFSPPGPPAQPGAGGLIPPPGQPGHEPAGDRNAIQVYSLERGEIIGNLTGHRDRVMGIALSKDGKVAVSHAADEVVILWDLVQGKPKHQSTKQASDVLDVAISPDARRGLMLLAGGVVKLNLDTFAPIGQPILTARLVGAQLPADALRVAAYSADGKGLIGGVNGKLFLLEPPDRGRPSAPKPLTGHEEAILAAAFDPSGLVAATAGGGVLTAGTLQPGRDHRIRLWDVPDHSIRWQADGHDAPVVCLAFSPDGSLLASGAVDGSIRVWRVVDGREVAAFSGHEGKILALSFSPDLRTLWSGSADRTLRIWSLR